MKKQVFVLMIVGLLLSAMACTNATKEVVDQDVLLATAYNKSLYLSELKSLTSAWNNPEDSIQVVNTYIENWVRESLLMHEAEKNVPKDLNIDELVRDYRASLIRHNYEKLLVESHLDSTVTGIELNKHFEEHKDQYILEESILRCYFLKIPKELDSNSDLSKWWKSTKIEDYHKMVDYCSKYATAYMLNDSTWYSLEELALQLPKGLININNLSKGKEFSLSNEVDHFYLRVFETMQKKEYAPLSYVKGQISKLILHKRKITLLDEKKQELVEREERRNNVKIYTQ